MIIYTDGSAHPNPGPGGFGVVVLDDNENIIKLYSKQFTTEVTNNEMEMKAILYAMVCYGKNDNVTVYSDSSYAVNTFNSWMFNWASNGWLKSNNQPPENLELVKAYFDLYCAGYRINLIKIKGHAGQKWNEMADQLATGKLQPAN